MSQTNIWNDKIEVKKGDLGEAIVNEWLIKRGYIPYTPDYSGAHPFDKLCASKDKKTIFIAEVKSKPARTHYPDTGINISNYNDYKHVAEKYNIDIYLFFVDEDKCKIYGGILSSLETPRAIIHNQKTIDYPLKHNGIIYFPLEAMNEIGNITSEQAKRLRSYSTRKGCYSELAEIST